MNGNTKRDLQAFITAVENLTHAVSSVAGTNVVGEVFVTADILKNQLDKDEAILP